MRATRIANLPLIAAGALTVWTDAPPSPLSSRGRHRGARSATSGHQRTP